LVCVVPSMRIFVCSIDKNNFYVLQEVTRV